MMRHLTDAGSKQRVAGAALLAAILTLAVAGIGGLVRGHHSTTAHQAKVASGWTSYSLSDDAL